MGSCLDELPNSFPSIIFIPAKLQAFCKVLDSKSDFSYAPAHSSALSQDGSLALCPITYGQIILTSGTSSENHPPRPAGVDLVIFARPIMAFTISLMFLSNCAFRSFVPSMIKT